MGSLMASFNRASAFYGDDMDSMMADVAIEILAMKDRSVMKDLTFFDKGVLLLCDKDSGVSEAVADNIRACMFWWVFNEEILENAIKELIYKSRKPLNNK